MTDSESNNNNKRATFQKANSFKEDPKVTEKTRELKFFVLEPGAAVISLGLVVEPDKYKRLFAWVTSLTGGIALTSLKLKFTKLLGTLAVSYALIPFGSGLYIRFLFGMATVMRALRVIEVLMNPQFFEERGIMYTVKFCYLYHDIRRARLMDGGEERQEAVDQALREVLQNALGLAFTTGLSKFPSLVKSKMSLSIISMFRFYFFTTMVEAGYRLHLCLFNIKPPVCFDDPWSSETLAEFWGQRWNLSIASQLRNIFFKPFAAAGYRKVGEFSVFLASACLHMIPIVWLGGSRKAIFSTATFFAMQPFLIAFEKHFRIRGRAWVQAVLWGASPLFALPLYEVTS